MSHRSAERSKQLRLPGVSTDGIELFERKYPDRSQDDTSPPQLAWAEVNALALPYAVLNEREAGKSQGHELLKLEKVGEKQVAFRWQVWPNPKYGMPTMLSLRILFVLMQKAADAKSETGSVPEILEIGSLSALCKAVGLPADGYSRNLIKKHIRILTATQCMSQGTFKNKSGEGLFIDSFSFLRSVAFVGDRTSQEHAVEKNFVVFDEHVRANLNAHYVKQIDLAFMREIRSPIGQMLYTKLSHLFHEANDKGWEFVEVEYQWLAERMGITVYPQLYRARAQLKQAINELMRCHYVKEATWDGWRIRFVPEVRFTFGEELPRLERRSRVITVKPAARPAETNDEFDALRPVCEVYAKNGWQLVAAAASRRGLTEQQLRDETISRGLEISPDVL